MATAAVAAFALVAHPALAAPGRPPDDAALSTSEPQATGAAGSAAPADPPAEPDRETGGAEGGPSEAAVEALRAVVAARLLALGYGAREAGEAAAALTADDLRVLAANPKMLQRAGDLSNLQLALLVGALIVAGLIVLAIASDGFVMVSV